MPHAIVFGARNLGGAILDRLLADGWTATGVARSEDTLAAVRERGADAVAADATDPGAVEEVLRSVPRVDLAVNAAASYGGSGAFGGGPIAEADLDGFEGWAAMPARQAFVFLSACARVLGPGSTIVQCTGGSARRANPGRGLWAAGAFGVRAITQAAALELRESGVHVCLLMIDGTIESPKTAAFTEGQPAEALVDQADVAAAVAYLASQTGRAMTHELQVTPAGDRWLP
ncbi:MAG: hypothetical protein QOF76_1988 [Solirubrobacteraceae bacterium]|jgi:NAD(P)-dependent dehydrogenase (short-subunit alcohol dehydrogenase family)|nr:hypothetical protein [Solirubrobacteraceae bacterium]